MYELFYSPGACSMAAHILLEEMDAEFKLSLISVPKGEATREPYLSVNPKGRVPALRIPGEPALLTELPAILRYVSNRFPGREYVRIDDALLDARLEEWLAWLTGWVHGVGYGLIWRSDRFDPNSLQQQALITEGKKIVEVANERIEAVLADDRMWSVGQHLSIVDPLLLVLYRWGNRVGFDMQERYRAWTRLSLRMAARPAVQRVLEREGVSLVA